MQFVNFTAIMARAATAQQKESAFALAALMEVPIQYKATMELGILGYEINDASARCRTTTRWSKRGRLNLMNMNADGPRGTPSESPPRRRRCRTRSGRRRR
jgi:hypothetical protein